MLTLVPQFLGLFSYIVETRQVKIVPNEYGSFEARCTCQDTPVHYWCKHITASVIHCAERVFHHYAFVH